MSSQLETKMKQIIIIFFYVKFLNICVTQREEHNLQSFYQAYHKIWSPGSSGGIVTRYELEGPGIESRWGEIFRTYPYQLRGPPSLLYNGYRVFPGGNGGWGVMLNKPTPPF